MKIEYSTSKIKKVNHIFSEAKVLMSENRVEKSRAVFVSFLIPIVIFGVLYIIDSVTYTIGIYFYDINRIRETAVVILKFSLCFFVTTPLMSEVFLLCCNIARSKTINCNVGYCKSLYFFFGVIIRTVFTAALFILICFSNRISYEIASYFCIDDGIVFPVFAVLSIILFLISLYRLTAFSFVFHLFINNEKITVKKAKLISRRILNGHFCESILINVRCILCVIPCVFTLGILSLYFIPRYIVTKTLFFKYIFTEKAINLKNYNSSYIKRTMEVKANEI